MRKSNGKILTLLFAITVVASKNLPSELSQDELRQIQLALQQLTGPKYSHSHGRPHEHVNHDEPPNDRTSIQTLNLIFKHNNIGQRDIKLQDQENADVKATVDIPPCKGIGRCGCPSPKKKTCACSGPKKQRCGCPGRCGEAPEEDETGDETEGTLAGALMPNIKPLVNLDLPNDKDQAETNAVPNYGKVENALSDLEKVLYTMNSYQGTPTDSTEFTTQCKGDMCEIITRNDDDDNYNDDVKNDSDDDNVKMFLEDLEKSLVPNNNEFKCSGLRCGCNKIGRCGCTRVRCDCNSDRCELEDDKNDDDRPMLSQNRATQLGDSKSQIKPKIYKLDDDLDAYVVDASNANDLLKKLGTNLGFNLQDSARAKRLKRNSRRETKNRKPVKRFRRSSGLASYGLPFEIEFGGLGQVTS